MGNNDGVSHPSRRPCGPPQGEVGAFRAMNVQASLPARDHILRAILAVIFSVACFSVLNAISKTLMQHYPVVQVIWARYVFAFAFMMALFLPRSGLALFRWHNIGTQAVRGL